MAQPSQLHDVSMSHHAAPASSPMFSSSAATIDSR